MALFHETCYIGPDYSLAVSARESYSLACITEHLNGKQKKIQVFFFILEFPSLFRIIWFWK